MDSQMYKIVDGCFDWEVVNSQRYLCDKSLWLTDFVFSHMSISLAVFFSFI